MFSFKYIALLIAAQPASAVQHHLGHKLAHRSQQQGKAVPTAGDAGGKEEEKKKAWYCFIPFVCPADKPEGEAPASTEHCIEGNKIKYTWFWFITRSKTIENNPLTEEGKCAGVSLSSITEWQDANSKKIEPKPAAAESPK